MSDESVFDDIEEQTSDELIEQLKSQKPTGEERDELLEAHSGHLVRDTTSQLSFEKNIDMPGVEVDATVEIPDTYCFSCEEWVGLSGVELAGTPRSREDAYYLHGEPDNVRELRQRIREQIRRIGQDAQLGVEHIDTPRDALNFIKTEIERMETDLVDD